MSCPWAKIEKTEPVNLEEIMCEQFAKTQQVRKEQKYDIPTSEKCFKKNVRTTETFESDEKIAQMFQVQYDKEYNDELKYSKNNFNRVPSMSEFLDNYQQTNYCCNSDTGEDILDIEVTREGRELDYIPQYNYKVKKDSKVAMVSDIIMSKRKNNSELSASVLLDEKITNFDGDLKLWNKIFHNSKMFPMYVQINNSKLLKEQLGDIIDQFSCVLLCKMMDSRLFQNINGIINGKEAVIFHAERFLQSEEAIPKEFAVKVFRDTIPELKYYLYLKDDYRFKNKITKQKTRKTTYLWAEKQMANLIRLKNAGIRCPDVIMLKNNILVMSFIGERGKLASKLEYAEMRMEDYITAYNEVVAAMKIFYKKANLIHADLSEHSIFWYNNHCYFIDVSQAVETSHEDAFSLLYQDCTNVCEFFSRKRVPDVLYPDELFNFILGM